MLSSITPLGERARQRSWVHTVVAFCVGAVTGGAIAFGAIGVAGSVVMRLVPADGRAAFIVVIGVAAGTADALRWRAPSRLRQVDENWLIKYRGWVAGLGYGAQLGAGFVTVIPVFGTFAVAAVVFLLGGPFVGAGVGVAYGLGRAATVMTTYRVDSWDRLVGFHRRHQGRLAGAHTMLLVGYAGLVAAGVAGVT